MRESIDMHVADELGHESNDLIRLQQMVLQALAIHDLPEPFLQEVLGSMQACLVAEEIAVVNSNPPQWHVLMQAGRSAASIPLELAADTLDRNQSVSRSGWVGYPLNQEYALLVQGGRGSQVAESCVTALVPAIAVLLDLQHRRHRIKLLETILDITHSWPNSSLSNSVSESAAQLTAIRG